MRAHEDCTVSEPGRNHAHKPRPPLYMPCTLQSQAGLAGLHESYWQVIAPPREPSCSISRKPASTPQRARGWEQVITQKKTSASLGPGAGEHSIDVANHPVVKLPCRYLRVSAPQETFR